MAGDIEMQYLLLEKTEILLCHNVCGVIGRSSLIPGSFFRGDLDRSSRPSSIHFLGII